MPKALHTATTPAQGTEPTTSASRPSGPPPTSKGATTVRTAKTTSSAKTVATGASRTAKNAKAPAGKAPAGKAVTGKAPAGKAATGKAPAGKAPGRAGTTTSRTRSKAKKGATSKVRGREVVIVPPGDAGAVDRTDAASTDAASTDAASTDAASTDAASTDADDRFFEAQRLELLAERDAYTRSANSLRAEAEELAQDREPGDVQFDEESGEGDSMNVERERDLALSAQALASVEEIDRALAKIEQGTYGVCEKCGEAIPRERLKALPHASLCVRCKSGGLSRR